MASTSRTRKAAMSASAWTSRLWRISRGAAEVLAAELLGVIGKQPDSDALTANVEQRLLGMKFSKPQTDYDLGYNDAVDDAMRAFGEAVEEVKGEAA